MSQYRDRLPGETRPAFDAHSATAGRSYAEGARIMHELAAAEGPMAVGRAAYFPGHPMGTPEAIAARYAELYGQAGARAA